MEFQEYIAIKRRMMKQTEDCVCNTKCSECPLDKHATKSVYSCSIFEHYYPERAEEIVKQWAEEHPVKTRASDFFEKYPNADRNSKGLPTVCAIHLGYPENCDYPHCSICWSKEVE